jgi:hypothetical protein
MNRKEGTVPGMAVNNRIGIQLQECNRRVSIKILNLRYQEGLGKNRQTLYLKVVENAQAEIALLKEGLRTQIRTTKHRHVDTAHMRYSLGRALWLSNKPLESTQALDEFQAAILFLKQREPTHHSLISFEKARDLAQESVTLFREPGTRSAWPYWRPPTSRREDKSAMIDLFRELLAMAGREREATITANTMQQGLRRHGLHGFTSSIPDLAFAELACDKIARMKSQEHKSEAISPLPTSLTTEPQSSPPSGRDDTQ